MKKIIRLNMFETNSSSTHSLTIKIKPENEKWKTEDELRSLDNKKDKDSLGAPSLRREIRSKYAKIIILYQSYVNYYTNAKYDLIMDFNNIDGIEVEEPDYPAIVYTEPYTKYVSYDLNKYDEYDKQMIKEIVDRLEDLDEELKRIKSLLNEEANKLNEQDRKDAHTMFDLVDKSPTNDETAIGGFYSNSLLDMYYDYSGFMDFVYALDVKSTDVNYDTIKRALEDDVYFDAREGFMAYDDMPRIL